MKKLTIGILMGLTVMSQAMANDARFSPKNLFVKVKKGQSLTKSQHIKSAKKLIGRIYLVKTDNLKALEAELSQSEAVDYTQKDYYAPKKLLPKHEELEPTTALLKRMFDINYTFNDPDAGRLWAFNSKAGMNVTTAYDKLPNKDAEEIIVAVVDTGVDHNHEDLKDIMWTNTKEIPGNGIDDDGNGYIDDVHGINTLVRDRNGNATTDTMASHWHGTHVAGTIAATQNNGIGITGVANNVKIMAIRTVPDDADELDSDIVEGFLYAARNGAKIINCSFGKKHNEQGMIVRDIMNEIGERYNTLIVVSAGNDSTNNDVRLKYPASFDSDNMIVIASTTSNGGLSYFSNYGVIGVDVAAPGSDIYSTINNNKYSNASGTSMAAPNASGVAAMVLGYNPHLSALGLKEVLMNSVTKVPAFQGKVLTGGRVNLEAALKEAKKKQYR